MALHDLVVLVSGASRGAGRGMALALGSAGATVVVTGRSTRGSQTTEGLPGTIEDTADEVTRRGGRGVAIRCDHSNPEQVEALFGVVRHQLGRLDVLVNNAWGGYEAHDGATFNAPVWEQPIERWDSMAGRSLRGLFLTARAAIPLMLESKGRLIAHTTAADQGRYLGSLPYDLAKYATARMAFGLANELKGHGITALTLVLGFTRTERVIAAGAGAQAVESPEFAGRVLSRLIEEPSLLTRTGRAVPVASLARELDVTDVDGSRPAPFELPESMRGLDPGLFVR